jgi:hypothetical protein
MAQYFDWTATGMHPTDRQYGGPVQYVRDLDYERLEAENLILKARLIRHLLHKGDCTYFDDVTTCSCGALARALE